LGLEPWRRGAPQACAEGLRPSNPLSARGLSNRVRAPIAATRVTAARPGTPRNAGRASTPGAKRHAGTCARRSRSRRRWRSRGSRTARPSSCQARGGAGGGQPTAESQRRWAGPPVARPVSRMACRSQQAFSRDVASVSALRGASRARARSRIASSAPVGTSPAGRAPARARRASCTASLGSVWPRAPGFLGSSEGATPPRSSPVWVRSRWSREPQGPAA
jgi:hypothetical protein